ncbi:MAG: heparinase, partial [Erythrobacter sp.]
MATLLRTPAGRRADALVERVAETPVLALAEGHEPLVAEVRAPPPPEEPGRALALSDVIAVPAGPGEALLRLAYRFGIPG